jgi:large repetitive protein
MRIRALLVWAVVGAGCQYGELPDAGPPDAGPDAAPLPVLSLYDFSVNEGQTGTTTANFAVTLTPASADVVTVEYDIGEGTALLSEDFEGATGTLRFEPGETTKPLTIPVVADARFEPDETMHVRLSSPVGALLTNTEVVGTITNDDAMPSLSIDDVFIEEKNEGDTVEAVFTVTLSAVSGIPASVDYATSDAGATAGTDYLHQAGRLEVPSGQTSATIVVPIQGERVGEYYERFNITLSNPLGATIADDTAVGTITPDEGPPTLGITGVHNIDAEGLSGTKELSWKVATLNEVVSERDITLDWRTVDGTATVLDADYVETQGTLVIPAGETEGLITVLVNGDSTVENDETFGVELIYPGDEQGITLYDTLDSGTISNDDSSLPSITVANVSASEGGTLTFTLLLAPASGQTVSVAYTTRAAPKFTALTTDYQAKSGTVTFAAGVTSQTVQVLTTQDALYENSEFLELALSSPTNAVLGTLAAKGTITNDDPKPSLTMANVQEDEGRGAVFTLTQSAVSGLPSEVQYTTTTRTIGASALDFIAQVGTARIPAGSTTATITVALSNDDLDEDPEEFDLELSLSTAYPNATLSINRATGTIKDTDAPPGVSLTGATNYVYESAVGQQAQLTTQVQLQRPSGKPISVVISTREPLGGMVATEGDDYQKALATVSFAPGETSKDFIITVSGDLWPEPDESIELYASSPVNVQLGGPRFVFIKNDDAPPQMLAITDAEWREDVIGGLNFTLNLSNESPLRIDCEYSTFDGSATAGSDYAARMGTHSWVSGTDMPKAVNVPITVDGTREDNETLELRCVRTRNVLYLRHGTGRILNDDG